MAKNDFSAGKRILPMNAIAPMNAHGIRDLNPNTYWFSALEPTTVIAPPGYKPRQWGFTPGANLIWEPKGDSPITFAQLRELADGWDILRLMIEQRKDELCAQTFEIRAKRQPGETNADQKQRNLKDPTVQGLNQFFIKPDGVHPFKSWLRMWLEDMIVVDAVALWFARDSKGKTATIHPLAGDTINRELTDQGLTPPPPSVAYQQVVYGYPTWNFTTDDLIYFMANERTNKRYGYSKVEQIILTINIGLRREIFQLNYYTDGNVPEAMVFLPSDLPIDRVKEVQDWFDISLAGDLAKRRRITFLPGYGSGDQAKPNVVFPKETLLKDEMDVWLVQIAAYCIGVSAQPFLKMMNRASAEEANDAASIGGLQPDVNRVVSVLNLCLDKMGYGDDYEFTAQATREPDILKQAQADNILVGKIVTTNEIREDRGLDPRAEPEADQLGAWTATGFVPLGSEQQNNGESDDEDDNEPDGDDNNSGSNKVRKTTKKRSLTIKPRQTKTSRFAHRDLTKSVANMLTKAANQVVRNVKKKYPRSFTKLRKADFDLDALIAIDWAALPPDIQEALAEVAVEGAAFGLAQLSVDQPGMINKANTVASAWAEDRAAEMVGMKWVDGKLVQNPSAQWAISDSTRDRLKTIIQTAFDDETPMNDLISQIQESALFSVNRAETVARTEVSLAQNQGNLLGWKTSGLVKQVSWVLSSEHDATSDCQCEDNADEGPYNVDEVPDFPAHPNCMCNLQTTLIGEANE